MNKLPCTPVILRDCYRNLDDASNLRPYENAFCAQLASHRLYDSYSPRCQLYCLRHWILQRHIMIYATVEAFTKFVTKLEQTGAHLYTVRVTPIK